MKAMTDAEAKQWCFENGFEFSDDRPLLSGRTMSQLTMRLPTGPRERVALIRAITGCCFSIATVKQLLVWFWDEVGSPEINAVGDSTIQLLRYGLGIDETIGHSPAQIFHSDNSVLHAFLAAPFSYEWECYLLCNDHTCIVRLNEETVTITHDSSYQQSFAAIRRWVR